MRLLTDYRTRLLALGLTALLAACGRGPGDTADFSSAAAAAPTAASYGPEGDYPVVVGEPYSVDGQLFTPNDSLNYDEVGYASVDAEGAGVTASHKTLPLPSYVEVTSLESGETALVRVERRGPMTSQRLVGLSKDAMSQLKISDGKPIRIRRVNALEIDRAKLRMGQAASPRMATPASLVAILKRKLPESGSVSLAQSKPTPEAVMRQANNGTVALPKNELPRIVKPSSPAESPKPAATRAANSSFADAFSNNRGTVSNTRAAVSGARGAATQYPLPPLSGSTQTSRAPQSVPKRLVNAPTPVETAPAAKTGDAEDVFVVQAAAFSSKKNAERAAKTIDGFVEESGRYYRVRKGPFVNRGQAEAALAKVRAAGYRDARVFSAG